MTEWTSTDEQSVTFGTGITFPAEHPAVRDPKGHRPPFSALRLDGNKHTITIGAGGYIDGPFTVGEGWTLSEARSWLSEARS